MAEKRNYERIPFDDTTLPIRINHSVILNPHPTAYIGSPSWHEQIEILYFHQGKAKLKCSDQLFEVQKGDVVIINSFEPHQVTQVDCETVYDCIMIDSALYRNATSADEEHRFFQLLADSRIGFKTLVQNDHEIIHSIETICKEDKTRPLFYDIAIRVQVLDLLVHLFRRHVQNDVSFYRLIDNLQQYDRIQPALDLMRSRLGEHIALEELAATCHLSASHFCRLFRQITGYSPIQYLVELRLQEAATLLKRTDKTISQIAYEVGFDDIGYFSRKFKTQFGISPTKAKKR
ncbi:MAG: helix-turn-helix domain-containing protein [Clostridia bacterium]|nr:helix-turn-helix domain-containing protein [Clostridia bacterium]